MLKYLIENNRQYDIIQTGTVGELLIKIHIWQYYMSLVSQFDIGMYKNTCFVMFCHSAYVIRIHLSYNVPNHECNKLVTVVMYCLHLNLR